MTFNNRLLTFVYQLFNLLIFMLNQQPKYSLDLNDFVTLYDGTKLYRIIALRDFSDVKAGDKGGYIQSEDNLSHDKDCWAYGDAWVGGNARVAGDARLLIGEYPTSPLYIQGSRYALTLNGTTHIAIGCQCLTFEEWLGEKGEEFSEKEGFTQKQKEEYKRYIHFMRESVKV